MAYVDGWLSRDTKKAGGAVKFWTNKPTKGKDGCYRGRNLYGKDNPVHETPKFSMTEESFVEEYSKDILPDVGTCSETDVAFD